MKWEILGVFLINDQFVNKKLSEVVKHGDKEQTRKNHINKGFQAKYLNGNMLISEYIFQEEKIGTCDLNRIG